MLHSALSHNKSVICSDTNLTQKSVNQIVSIAKEYDAEVEIKDFFDVSIKELIERDKNRPKSVGENKIRDLFYKHVKNMPTFVKFNPVLPFVVVCDLDGTLYLDETKHKLSTEDINIGVAHTLDGIKVINYCKVFILSTREASLTEQTEEWLERNSIEHDKLFTLEVDDESSEECKKAKFIEEQIIGKYNVLLWLDDDPQVCNMLRDVYGFNVAQLGDPNYRKKE